MVEAVALAALTLDAALGWPSRLHARIGHPVGGFARIIAKCERRWNRPGLRDGARRIGGVATLLVLLTVAIGCGWAVEWLIQRTMGSWAWVGVALAAWPALAQRSLYDHVLPVARALEAGKLDDARRAVACIVGRDTASLDEAGVSRAAVESLAESFCDGVVAPLFWLLLGGLPGIWAYKAANTADSLIGHREKPYGPFGWAAARFDDLLNLAPARLSGFLVCVAGGRGWRVMWRDHKRHASPNAGWPEAAMAGALRVRLGGPIRYDGVLHDKPWIGGSHRDVTPADLRRAMRIFLRACALLWGLSAFLELGL
ncbi:adenosylcobinamide-phosphate synthase CbiB [Sphingobium vermicomposti]|uniref:Cobalamin biosynthesis protein CobD n=1 Tax=Sphingobium vermicomposti TaxID=529005 RepID=A0A846MHZ0_9SPHN|nr:adenosylcobinamide-phosphate synthase [Sphingobium vermicomposti]